METSQTFTWDAMVLYKHVRLWSKYTGVKILPPKSQWEETQEKSSSYYSFMTKQV